MSPFYILLLALYTTDLARAFKTLSIAPKGGHAMTKRDIGPMANSYNVKVYNLHVESQIENRFATTRISSRIANSANVSQEVFFSVVIPETAFISGFKMEVDGKVHEAYVKEKEAAKREYTEAVARGQGAAHVAASARDSNHFTVSVNVEPTKKVTFNLTYDELLTRRMGTYNLAINIDPGQVVRDMTVDVHIKEKRNITVLRVPALRSGNEVDADDTTRVNDLATITMTSPTEALVSFSPTSEQQESLGHIGSRQERNPKKTLKGQFVVQYDVDRDSEAGDVLVTDGYFVHFFAPKNLLPLRKHVVFLLDVSGSMHLRKLDQLKEAMATILDNLNVEDYFNIIEFSDGVKVWNLDSMSESYSVDWNKYPWRRQEDEQSGDRRTPTPAFPATESYIKAAKQHVTNMDTIGSTNIYDALHTALHVAHVGLENVTDNSADEKPQPIIFFLTDGQATGKQPREILPHVLEENQNPPVAIFSLAFGDDADFDFLKKLSLRHSGFARKIYEASDAALQLRDFYRQIASPLLANVSFSYQPDKVVDGATTRTQFPALFMGSEIIIAGKIPNNTFETSDDYFEGEVSGVSKSGARNTRIHLRPPQLYPQVSINHTVTPIEKLWAYLTIKQLLENQDALTDDSLNQSLSDKKQRALELALKYSFVTPLTSLVVVKPNSTEDLGTKLMEDIPPGVGYQGAVPKSLSVMPMVQGYSLNIAGSWGMPRVGAAAPVSGLHTFGGTASHMVRPASSRSGMRTYGGAHAKHSHSVQHESFYQMRSLQTNVQMLSLSDDHGAEPMMPDIVMAKVNTTGDSTQPPQLVLELIPLEDVDWLNGVKNGSEVTLPLGPSGENQTYSLQLTPGTSSEAKSCQAQVPGDPGVCNHLINCPLNVFKHDIQTYRKYFCDLNNFAGVCCPINLSRTVTTTASPAA